MSQINNKPPTQACLMCVTFMHGHIWTGSVPQWFGRPPDAACKRRRDCCALKRWKNESEMMRGRTDREGERWWGCKHWPEWSQGMRGPLSVCVQQTKRHTDVSSLFLCLCINTCHSCEEMYCMYCSQSVYSYISTCVLSLCWKGSMVERLRVGEVLCAAPRRGSMPQGLTFLSTLFWLQTEKGRKQRWQAKEKRLVR